MANSPPGRESMLGQTGPLVLVLSAFGLIFVLVLLASVGAGDPDAIPGNEAPRKAYRPEMFSEVLHTTATEAEGVDPEGSGEDYYEPYPEFIEEMVYPCSDCHEGDPGDPTPRDRFFHEFTLDHLHADEGQWCMDCHDADNRDMLHLAGGQLISFDERERLCAQCHDEAWNDWRHGLHGLRTGFWNGPKHIRRCSNCHRAHDPSIRHIRPLPPPVGAAFIGTAEQPTEPWNPDITNVRSVPDEAAEGQQEDEE